MVSRLSAPILGGIMENNLRAMSHIAHAEHSYMRISNPYVRMIGYGDEQTVGCHSNNLWSLLMLVACSGNVENVQRLIQESSFPFEELPKEERELHFGLLELYFDTPIDMLLLKSP